MHQYCCTVNASQLLLHFCSVHPAKMFAASTLQKCLKHPPCKIFKVSNLQNAASIQKKCVLQNVCSVHPICCKIFAVLTLQNVSASTLEIKHFLLMVALSTLQNVCSLCPAKFLLLYTCNIILALTLAIYWCL